MNHPSSPFLLRTLGALQLERTGPDGAHEVVQRAGKPLALLAYLVANDGRPVARAALADLLWGDESAESARASLRQAVHTLRKLLGDEAVEGDRAEVSLSPAVVDSDHRRFLEAAVRGDAVEMSEWYRGPFCGAVEVRGARAWEQWRDAERERLRRQLVAAWRREVEARTARGDTRGAAGLARLVRQAEPALAEVVEVAADALGADGAFDEARMLLEEQRARDRAEGLDARPGIESRLARLERSREARGALEAPRAAESVVPRKLVGREEVLTTLFRALERARGGETTHLALIGPAGIGKSRVLDEFEARVRTRNVRVARVRFLPAMREIPYAALAEFARALSALPGAMGIGEASAGALVALLPELRVQFPSAPSVAAAPEELLRLRSAAIADLVAAVSEDRLTVLLRDDEHNADAASRAALATALGRRDLRLLDVLTSRQMVEAEPALEVVPLSPLSTAEVRRLLEGAGRLPDAPWVDEAMAALVAGSAGIPQLLLQRLRVLGERGALRATDGAWDAPDPSALSRSSSPATELGLMVGALRPDDRFALEVLALWRRPLREVDATAVLAMLRRAPREGSWRDALAHLEERGLAVVREDGWVVSHDTVAEAVLAAMAPGEIAPPLRAFTRHFARSGALTVPVLEHLASLCGSWQEVEAAGRLVQAASRDRALREVGVKGAALAQRVALAAGRPEWSGALEGRIAWLRRQSRGALLAWGSAAGIAAAALFWFLWMLQPRIVIEAEPMAELISMLSGRSLGSATLVVQPRIAVRDGFGRLLDHHGGSVHLRSPNRVLVGDTVIPIVNGRAQFERVGIRGLLPGVDTDSNAAVFEFRSGIARSARVSVAGAWGVNEFDHFRVVGVVVNGTPVDSTRRLRLPVGDTVAVDLTFEFTTLQPTANYVVAAAPNWGPHREGTIRLAGLPRPVRQAWQTVHFRVAPRTAPGIGHVVVLMGAEDSAEHLMSLTSWTVGPPRWNDGRDVQDLSRGKLDSLRTVGVMRALAEFRSYGGLQSDIRLGDLVITRAPAVTYLLQEAIFHGTAIEIDFYDPSPVR